MRERAKASKQVTLQHDSWHTVPRRSNLIREQDEELLDCNDASEDGSLEHGSSVGWVNQPVVPAHSHSCDSVSSDNNVVMAIRSKTATELKVAGAQSSVKINGRTTRSWIDSGSPISILTVGAIMSTLGWIVEEFTTEGYRVSRLCE